MIGFPLHLNTKHDYQFIHDHFPSAKWQLPWQALLDTKDAWLMTDLLQDEQSGVEDVTHRIEAVDLPGGALEYYQYEFKEDPNALIFRLGFTAIEVEDTLKAAVA